MNENENATATGINLFANISLELGNKIDKLAQAQQRLANALQTNTPVDYQTFASGTYPSSGFLTLNLGTPDLGTYWEIHNIAVGGTDVNVTAAGTAGLYVSGSPGSGGMNLVRDRAGSLPNVSFYGTRVLLVSTNECLYLNIYGGTAGQTYVANASMTVFRVASASGKSTVIE